MSIENLGAVLIYEDRGRPGAQFQTIGADGSGDFVVLFYGDPDVADAAARDYLRKLDRAGRIIKNAHIVPNKEGYTGYPVQAIEVASG